MSDIKLGGLLREITPEPPTVLSIDSVLRQARRRHRRRVALASLLPLLLVIAVAGTTVVVQRSAGRDSLVTAQPTPQKVPRATPNPSPSATPQAPTDMHSRRAPTGPLTAGSADVDGDGQPDRVVVSTSGLVTVRLATGAALAAWQPRADASLRLQGIADLWTTGTKDILMSASAAGCCGYESTASNTNVLTLVGGRLVLVRTAEGAPLVLSFSDGRGDVYAGITCDVSRHLVTQAEVLQTGRTSATRRFSTISLAGSRATVRKAVPQQLRSQTYADLASHAGARGCPGLSRNGWAE